MSSSDPQPQRPDAPTVGSEDELLADPPQGRPPDALDGYRAGRSTRRIFGLVVVGLLVAGAWIIKRRHDDQVAALAAEKTPTYQLSTTSSQQRRPDQLVWSDGFARLGLTRQEPGVHEIVLPDRRLRLADGYDQAQITVMVEHGATTEIKVLTGKIIEFPP